MLRALSIVLCAFFAAALGSAVCGVRSWGADAGGFVAGGATGAVSTGVVSGGFSAGLSGCGFGASRVVGLAGRVAGAEFGLGISPTGSSGSAGSSTTCGG